MTEHGDDPNEPTDPELAVDDARTREDERIRQLILARRNRFMAAALAGAGVALNGCWDSASGEPAPDGGAAGQSGSGGGAGGVSGASGLGGTGGPTVCLSIDPCADNGSFIPPCVCLSPPFDAGTDAGVDENDGGVLPPSVCLTPAE